jgi:hypothetical protein
VDAQGAPGRDREGGEAGAGEASRIESTDQPPQQPSTAGGTTSGCECACLNLTEYPSSPPNKGVSIAHDCTLEHEEYHVHSTRGSCKYPEAPPFPRVKGVPPSKTKDEECCAYATQIACLCDRYKECGTDANCFSKVFLEISLADVGCQKLGGDVYGTYGAPVCPYVPRAKLPRAR